MFDVLLIASCLVIDGEQYCKTNAPNPDSHILLDTPTQIEDRKIETTIPIHMLKSHEMTDPRWANLVFTFNTPFDANNCLESLLYTLEGDPTAGVDTTCGDLATTVFGSQFAPNTPIAENVVRMWANRLRGVLKRPVVTTNRMAERLYSVTGLTIE